MALAANMLASVSSGSLKQRGPLRLLYSAPPRSALPLGNTTSGACLRNLISSPLPTLLCIFTVPRREPLYPKYPATSTPHSELSSNHSMCSSCSVSDDPLQRAQSMPWSASWHLQGKRSQACASPTLQTSGHSQRFDSTASLCIGVCRVPFADRSSNFVS